MDNNFQCIPYNGLQDPNSLDTDKPSFRPMSLDPHQLCMFHVPNNHIDPLDPLQNPNYHHNTTDSWNHANLVCNVRKIHLQSSLDTYKRPSTRYRYLYRCKYTMTNNHNPVQPIHHDKYNVLPNYTFLDCCKGQLDPDISIHMHPHDKTNHSHRLYSYRRIDIDRVQNTNDHIVPHPDKEYHKIRQNNQVYKHIV